MSKTILITGASSGIGKASVALFASKGWNVIATMRRPDASLEADNLLVEKLDVQDVDSIQHAVDAGIARFGAIDVLLNNAGFGQYGLFEALSQEAIQTQFDVNVFGVMNVIRSVSYLRHVGQLRCCTYTKNSPPRCRRRPSTAARTTMPPSRRPRRAFC